MFRAVREQISNFGSQIGVIWQDVRQRKIGRLFLFEFVVVLLGVLAAQMLQDWAREREAHAEMEEARRQFVDQAGYAMRVVEYSESTLECLDRKVGLILVAAGEKSPITSKLRARPTIWTADLDPLSEANALRLRAEIGSENFYALRSLIEVIANQKEVSEGVALDWNYFALIDPDNGPVSEIDYGTVRQAGARIQANLRRLRGSFAEAHQYADQLDISAESGAVEGNNIAEVTNCE